MTGHPTSGQPADREQTSAQATPASTGTASPDAPSPHAISPDATSPDATGPGATGAGAAGVGAAGGLAGDFDIELDQELAVSAERLLEVLQSTLDINAGLAAIRATHRTATGPPISTRPDGVLRAGVPDQPDRTGQLDSPRPHDSLVQFDSPGQVDQSENAGEVGAVCGVLAGYLTALSPAGEQRTGATAALGGSVLALGAVYRLLRELRHGLLNRSLDRPAAERLLRLIDHNTTEAGHLLREETRRATRRARPQIEGWARITTEVRDGMVGLRPRIARLYDDADQATDQPATSLPV